MTEQRHGGTRPGAGRPMTDANERAAIREARRIGRLALPAALSVLVTCVLDKAAPMSQRIRCASELCDRLGLPRQSNVAAQVEAASIGPDEIESLAKTLVREIVEEQANQLIAETAASS